MNPFVFLVGCPRSGTTLLQRIVDAHPEIEIVAELERLAGRYALRDGLTDDGHLTPAFIRLVFEEGFGRYVRPPIGRAEADQMARRHVAYADFYTRFFDRYGEMRGKQLVGNKSVRESRSIPVLHELWPHAKFVHLTRDGRDVALSAMSWRRAEKLATRFPTWRDDPISTAAAWWEWHVRPGRDAGRTLGPERYREVRYEQLVVCPAEEAAALCAFLGVPYDDAMVRFNEGREQASADLGDGAKHTWRPPTPGLRDWRSQMSRDDVARFEAVAGELLDELSYERGAGPPSPELLAHAAEIRRSFAAAAEREDRRSRTDSKEGGAGADRTSAFHAVRIGKRVKVKGRRANEVFVASKVTIRKPKEIAAIEDVIDTIDHERKVIRILGRDVALPDECKVLDLWGGAISVRELSAGTRVKLVGTYSHAGGFVAASILVRPESDVEELQGDVEAVDAAEKTFAVLGIPVTVNDATQVKNRGEAGGR